MLNDILHKTKKIDEEEGIMLKLLNSASIFSLSLCLVPSVAHADAAPNKISQSQIEEIIVTAEKRQERINDVPLSITALTGDQLKSRNVETTADLVRVVPGFNYQTSLSGLPIYYIRGVGYADSSVAATPAVTVYTDEVPLPVADMTRGAALDLTRVEVLKGPQGTLFGMNSTGGAINYIAARPTDELEAGASMGLGRFGAANMEGYVSGPLADKVSVRIAGEYRMQGDWQYSATRRDTRGQRDFLNGRLSIAAKPTDGLNLLFMASGWRDRSDTPSPQSSYIFPSVPFPPVVDALYAVAYTPTDARVTDWLAGSQTKRDDSFYQFALRGDLDLAEHVQLTSISSYSYLSLDDPFGIDGLNFPAVSTTIATARVFSQELRLSGNPKSLHWILGVNYQRSKIPDTGWGNPFVNTNSQGLYSSIQIINNQQVKDYAAFAGLEAQLTDSVSARASIRYSKEKRDRQGCLADFGNGQLAFAFGQVLIPLVLGGAPADIAPGSCVTLDDATKTPISEPAQSSLNEDNVSWRVGLDWKVTPGTMLYATVAKGYKAGGYSSSVPAVFVSQMKPVTQEALLAYEVGIKADLFDRMAHVDLAAFYYDYTDKQLQGYVNIVGFGQLPTLVNIPQSRIVGAEISLTARPTRGLRISLAGSILDTKVQEDPPLPRDPFGNPTTYVGESFPNTPKYQATADIEQSFPLSGNLEVYVGGGVQYHSSASGAFGSDASPLAHSLTTLPSYVLLDLRAGLRIADPDVRIEVWGKNVTNKYYYNAAVQYSDTFLRFADMPATWGIRLSSDF